MGLPYINGYKPAFNYQREMLDKQVADFLREHQYDLEAKFESFANAVVPSKVEKPDFANMLEQPPEKSTVKPYEPSYRPIKINYL